MKNSKFILRSFVAAVLLTALFSMTVFAGTWQRAGNSWRFLRDSGQYANNIMLCIDNVWYAFDTNGYMCENQWVQAEGNWYYFTGSGAMAANQWISGLYYVGSDGAMLTYTWTPDGYYVGGDGKWVPGGSIGAGGQANLGRDF